MRRFNQLVLIGLVAGSLGGTGCVARTQARVEIGARSAPEAPPSATEVYFEEKPGHVWVHGRWARQNNQWIWQPGHYEAERPNMVWLNGYWDRRDGKFVWVEGRWAQRREGQVFIPGYFDQRGNANVWIRDRWEPERVGDTWIPGRWEKDGGERRWVDGRWKLDNSPPKVVKPAPPAPPAGKTAIKEKQPPKKQK